MPTEITKESMQTKFDAFIPLIEAKKQEVSEKQQAFFTAKKEYRDLIAQRESYAMLAKNELNATLERPGDNVPEENIKLKLPNKP